MKDATSIHFTLYPDLPIVRFHNAMNNRQSQTQPTEPARTGSIDLIERVKDSRDSFLGDTHAMIPKLQMHVRILRVSAD
jgi:hypothetical protein